MPKPKQLKESITTGNCLNFGEAGQINNYPGQVWKCLAEEQEILSKWTEYSLELYNCERYGDNTVLDCTQHSEKRFVTKLGTVKGESFIILAELVQAGGGDHDF